MRIDAHQHFWTPARGDYGWMPEDNPILYRSYRPADLAPILDATGIDGTVLVQAAPSIEETEYMLGLADATPWILGVVGWIDFEDPAHLHHLRRFAQHPKFKAVRPMIQDIEETEWMLRPGLAWAFEAVADLGLVFDALGTPRHLAAFAELAARYPDLQMVLDHGLKPNIAAGEVSAWAVGMSRLAGTNAVCKLSGLITEASENWTVEDLKPYTDHILTVFGPDRVLWGSDWPVCRLHGEYGAWHGAAETLTAGLSAENLQKVFGTNAMRIYGLQ